MRESGWSFVFAVALSLLALAPQELHAAIINPVVAVTADGTTFSGTFEYDNDLFLLPFTLSGTSIVSADVSAGFETVISLFVPYQVGSDTDPHFEGKWFLLQRELIPLEPTELQSGDYLLALTQWNKFFSPTSGWDYSGTDSSSLNFRSQFSSCAGYFGAFDSEECGTGDFAGALSINESVPVPEPGTLTLVLAGIIGAGLRRSLRNGRGNSRARPSS